MNTSEKCDFQVDNTPPELRVRIQGNSYKGKYLFVSPDSKIELSALDGQSGVKTINYSINSNSLHNTYVKPFSLKDNKRHFLYYAAEDSMGNRTPRQRATIFVDKYLPNSHVYLSGPQHHRKDTLIISRETKIKFSGRDGESGVKEIVYKINSSKEMTYSQEFSLHDEGVNKLAFAAVDQVLNREWYNVKTVFLDTTPPVIHLQFNKDYIGSKTVRGKHYTIYPKNTLIFLNPTDNLSGTKKVEYTINGGPVKSTMPISGFHPGNYEIQYSALDAVNNKTELKKMEFSIE